MAQINQNFLKLPGGYLFPEIGRRVRAFSAENPPMPLIRLGIGDVTLPLAPVVVEAMVKAAREMGRPRPNFPPPTPWKRPSSVARLTLSAAQWFSGTSA